jgi:hypothetical protein
MADWISLREFARRRDVTLQAVQKAIATNRITAAAVRRDDTGRLRAIDADQAAIDWHRNTDPELALRSGTVIPPPASVVMASPDVGAPVFAGAPPDAPRQLALSTPDAPADRAPLEDDSYRRDRAENERLKKVNAELDLAERLKLLVPVAAVRRAAFESSREIHDTLIRLPDRLAPLLAAEVDPVKIHALMTHEIRGALNALAERAAELATA